MKFRNKNILALTIFLLFTTLIFSACDFTNRNSKVPLQDTTVNHLKTIEEKKVLKVAVDYNATDYFVYRGQPMGFQYDLLQDLAKDLGVELDIQVNKKLDSTFIKLQEGKYDLIAQNLTVTLERKEQVDFIAPLGNTKQVLVQRKRRFSSDLVYVSDLLELSGKTIHVQKNSAYAKRLMHLSEEIGGRINVVEHLDYNVDELIKAVAEGEIDFTICDQNLALMNTVFYPGLSASVEVSLLQNIAWAVKKGNAEWKNYLDNWITTYKKKRKFRQLYDKYYVSLRAARRMGKDFNNVSQKKISVYDELIKKYAKEYGWDWRLIASIINAESDFDPQVVSWGGAVGLMQLMPETGADLGAEDLTNPTENIRAGIKYLTQIDQILVPVIPDSSERIKFTLAAYNVGLGHLKDAQRLAEKNQKDKTRWDNSVGFYLKNKHKKSFYRDSVVKWGYVRGDLAYRYVNEVIHDYEVYKDFIPE